MKLAEAIKYGQANYSALPPVLQKSYDFINKVTKQGSDLESYKTNEAIKTTIDLAVSKFGELAAKQGNDNKTLLENLKNYRAALKDFGSDSEGYEDSTKEIFKDVVGKPLKVKFKGWSEFDAAWKVILDEAVNLSEAKSAKLNLKWKDDFENSNNESEEPLKPEPKKESVKKITKSVQKSSKSVQKTVKSEKENAEHQVEHLPLEIVLMKRFVNMHDKEKTPDQVMNLLDAVQKAIIEKRIGKKSQFSNEIDEIQKRLIKCYNSMIENKINLIIIKIDTKLYDKIKGIVDSYEALKSVSLIKRYINLDGKKQSKEKALKLKKDIQKILQTADFYKDPYAKVLNEIESNLINYTTGVDKHLKIDSQTLSGIPWVTIARKAVTAAKFVKAGANKIYQKTKPHAEKIAEETGKKAIELSKKTKVAYKKFPPAAVKKINKLKKKAGLGNIEEKKEETLIPTPTMQKINIPVDLKAEKLCAVDSLFNNKSTKAGITFRLYGDIGLFTGDLEQRELGITIEGDQGSGKTQLAYQLANAFLDLDKKVSFLCYELPHDSVPMVKFKKKYVSEVNQDKLKQKSDMPSGLDFIRQIASAFDVVIIDSWGKIKAKNKEFDDIRKEFPDTIFIILVQRLSNGDVRGGNDPKYDAGINIEVVKVDNTFENNYAYTSKNRYGASGLKYNISAQKLI